MHDEAFGEVEDRAVQWEAVRLGLPDQRQEVVQDAEPEQAAGDAEVALHRVEIGATVAAADRDPGDQVVEHELVQDDDAGPGAEGVDDPAVGLGVVADVVERDVRLRRALPLLGDCDLLDPLVERGQ